MRNLFLSVFLGIILHAIVMAETFRLKVGDILFQDLDCGVLCDGIGQVTYGINKTYMSHVGMVESIGVKDPVIIEAIGSGVIETPLSKFLTRSYDKSHNPMVMVGRLKPEYQHLIPDAIIYAKSQLGKPYNSGFIPNESQSFYCSQLIYKSFLVANKDRPIFALNKMNFADLQTGKITPEWASYFAEMKLSPPQGQIGTNPGMMSRESSLNIIYSYGVLRIHESA